MRYGYLLQKLNSAAPSGRSDLPWHLQNATRSEFGHTLDLNVLPVWQDYDGSGVRVGVFDDSRTVGHAALSGAFASSFADGETAAGRHGTAVAGIIGADPSSKAIGIAAGVHASMTQVVGTSMAAINQAMASQHRFDVVNHSWGWSREMYVDRDAAMFRSFFNGIDTAAQSSRDGLGTIMVAAGGNGGRKDGDADLSGFTADRQVIGVAAVTDQGRPADYSNSGASLLVAGLSSGGRQGITTTDLAGSAGYSAGDMTDRFGGTSAAAPMVTGIVALMLEANPYLGWRDVQEILALTARPVSGTQFVENGASHWNGGGLRFSNDVGFGLVDAKAAVRLSETWTARSTSANEASDVAQAKGTNLLSGGAVVEYFLSITSDLAVEAVELALGGRHSNIGDLLIKLISPLGTVSTLLDGPKLSAAFNGWTFVSNAFRGEESGGSWTLRVEDRSNSSTGVLTGAELRVFGSEPHDDETYVFTDAFARLGADAERRVIDNPEGEHTINAAALSTGVVIDLAPGALSTIAGRTLKLSEDTIIVRAYGGDGDDVIRGNDFANELFGGRGFNILEGRGGNDVLHPGPDGGKVDGGEGFDTVVIAGNREDFLIEIDGSTIILEADGGDAHYTLINVEHIRFDDASFVIPSSAEQLAVTRLHDMLQDQAPDPMNLADWSALLQGGSVSLLDLARKISPDAMEAPDPVVMAFDGIVERAYQTAFAREANQQEHAYWTDRLERGDLTAPDLFAHFAAASVDGFEPGHFTDYAFWV